LIVIFIFIQFITTHTDTKMSLIQNTKYQN